VFLGYLDRVGTFYLPVSLLYGLPSFLLTRFPYFTITKSQISGFWYFFGVQSKKIRICIPTPRRSHRSKGAREKAIVKVKTEDPEQRRMMKSIEETLEAIKVNLAENQKPR
jgi:hypothetical protein